MNRLIYLVLCIGALTACNFSTGKTTKEKQQTVKPDSIFVPKYARQFTIKYYNDHKVIEIDDPWDSLAAKHQVVLSSSTDYLKANKEAIKTPLKRWVAVASTQISYANEIKGAIHSLVGVAEPQYVTNKKVVQGLKDGTIRNIGTSFAPDLELLIDLDPEIMMVSPFKQDHYGSIRDAGIKIVMNSSYLENTPLGRVEWMVYVSAFFNKEKEAIKKVNDIASRYNRIKELSKNLTHKPTLLSGKLYQGTWYAAAAQSYNANFYSDAGANYIFKDRPGVGSLKYDYETVYDAGSDADFWIVTTNYNGDYSYSTLKDEDVRYKDFKAFKKHKVICANTNKVPFYEKGLLEPDVILSDMLKVFHPDLLPNYKPRYYKMLTKE